MFNTQFLITVVIAVMISACSSSREWDYAYFAQGTPSNGWTIADYD